MTVCSIFIASITIRVSPGATFLADLHGDCHDDPGRGVVNPPVATLAENSCVRIIEDELGGTHPRSKVQLAHRPQGSGPGSAYRRWRPGFVVAVIRDRYLASFPPTRALTGCPARSARGWSVLPCPGCSGWSVTRFDAQAIPLIAHGLAAVGGRPYSASCQHQGFRATTALADAKPWAASIQAEMLCSCDPPGTSVSAAAAPASARWYGDLRNDCASGPARNALPLTRSGCPQ